MKRTKVESPELNSIGFDAATQILEIELASGDVFMYYNVTAVVYNALMKAPLTNTYYEKYIKNEGYKTVRVF